MLDIYIDADACPVKRETYRVDERYGLQVLVIANRAMQVPSGARIQLIVAPGDFDAADNWIAAHVGAGDIVITADIPLAGRCLERGARVLGPKGHEFTPESIGEAIATRTIMDMLRQMGEAPGGPAPMDDKSRSRFLSRLDHIVNAIKNQGT